MRRPIVVSLAVVLVSLAVVSLLSLAPLPTNAQTGTPTAGDQGFVGAWHLTTTPPLASPRA